LKIKCAIAALFAARFAVMAARFAVIVAENHGGR